MIIVRDVFKLKFGKAKEALSLYKDAKPIFQKTGHTPDRVMTDYVGSFYTLVLEHSFKNFADYENMLNSSFSNEEYEKWYQKFTPLVENGYREVFRVVE
jgi:hypothetical protein